MYVKYGFPVYLVNTLTLVPWGVVRCYSDKPASSLFSVGNKGVIEVFKY